MTVVEFVLAGLFALGGVRSLVRWMGTEFEAETSGERVLYALHVTARVGLWFAFAGFFLGYGLLEDPRGMFVWYVPGVIGLAGAQLLTGLFLARGSTSERRGSRREAEERGAEP